MSNTPSLLPCPFCGKTHSLIVGAASEAWDADEHGPYPHTESYAVFCDASTDGRRGGCGGAGGYRLTKDEAIEVWNNRTPGCGDVLKLCPAMPTDAELLAHIKEAVPGLTRVNTALMVAKAVLEKFGSMRVAGEVK